jgi:hypothetical protein
MTTPETFMHEARQLAAQCWCDETTSDRVMDPALAEAVAKRIAAWMNTAAEQCRGLEFYRGIIVKVGEPFGDAAKTSDDGSIQADVLALKVPELVDGLRAERDSLKATLSALDQPRLIAANSAQEREITRLNGVLKTQADHWASIEAIAKEFGIGPDMSLASENLKDARWSYNDPCGGKLFREDEVVDEILRRIAELQKPKPFQDQGEPGPGI